jgi:hypothetical protein
LLFWDDNSINEDGFTLERQKDGAASWVQVGTTTANDTSFTDQTATCDQNYVYRVAATNTYGSSTYAVSGIVNTTCGIFTDVPGDLPAPFMEPWVEDFYQAGLTGGCNGGTPGVDLDYCPDAPVSRGAVAVFILRALNYPALPHTPTGDPAQIFADVPSPNQPPIFEDWIEDFYALGITQGCDTSPLIYCPEDPVSRGAMAVFILRALEGAGYTPTGDPAQIFADVPSPNQPPIFEDWIEDFYSRGITTGTVACADGTTAAPGELLYCPEDPVTRGAMAVFILRAFDAIPDPNDP